MTRVKRGTIKAKSRRYLLAKVKGFRHGRKSKKGLAKDALFNVAKHSFAHRRDKKNDFRARWNTQINASLRSLGTTYSVFINDLKKKDSELDRKVLADLAENSPETFGRIVESVK